VEEGIDGDIVILGMEFDDSLTDKATADTFGETERGFPLTVGTGKQDLRTTGFHALVSGIHLVRVDIAIAGCV
jgi:hypothetical protein